MARYFGVEKSNLKAESKKGANGDKGSLKK